MPVPKWRWDQGRLQYFSFGALRSISRVLVQLEGVSLHNEDTDPLRRPLTEATGLPFPPVDNPKYPVWRNFARVFAAALLATAVDDRLAPTDVARRLASDDEQAWNVDRYLCHLIPRFSFPSPAFSGYDATSETVFPFCALLKLLIAFVDDSEQQRISTEDVFALIIGNNMTGIETLATYRAVSYTHLTLPTN